MPRDGKSSHGLLASWAKKILSKCQNSITNFQISGEQTQILVAKVKKKIGKRVKTNILSMI
jgi:hypothetical protein